MASTLEDNIYVERIQAEFHNPDSQAMFGDTEITPAEFDALRALLREQRDDTGSHEVPLERIQEYERRREATLEHIKEHGYPLPEQVSPENVAVAGVAHACAVAPTLVAERGADSAETSYKSYTAKNRFDRSVRRKLPESLREEWDEPIERPGPRDQWNQAVEYPPGVDENFIHGAAKPARFFPAQLMRYLEFARLGDLDASTATALGINEQTDLTSFGIEWDSLKLTIENSTSLVDLAASIGHEVAEQLLENDRGLEVGQVAAILRKGYNVAAFTDEYGEASQTHEVYAALLDHLNEGSDRAKEVSQVLRSLEQ